FTLDYGGGAPELWNALVTHFTTIPGLVGDLAACAGSASASVSWTGAPTAGGPITSYQVTASPGGATVSVPGNATFATFTGLTAGTAYTFTVQGINSTGPGVGRTTDFVIPVAATVATSHLNWYDKASRGMLSDDIHVVSPGGTAADATVELSGAVSQLLSVAPGAEAYATFPAGSIGGPVKVTSSQPVLAAQRVQYNQTFNEVWALNPAQASATSYINWYDKASAGMVNDNIHLLNPGNASATVTVSLPGAAAQVVAVGPGAEVYVTFPSGTIGGPVTISSDQPVLASQRVQYYQTFNEIPSG